MAENNEKLPKESKAPKGKTETKEQFKKRLHECEAWV